MFRDWSICPARVEPAMARMGTVALYARENSWWSARRRAWVSVELVRRVGLRAVVLLWIEATLRTS